MYRKQNKGDIETAISNLVEATRDELAILWTTRKGHSTPKGCSRTLLELAEAYGIQTHTFGDLKPSLRRKLEAKPNGISGENPDAQSEAVLDAAKVHRQALSSWENEDGWIMSAPYDTVADIPEMTNTDIVDLRVRLITLEGLMFSLLAKGSDPQRQMACDMAAYISPRPGFTPHALTVKAADHMTDLVDGSVQFRAVR